MESVTKVIFNSNNLNYYIESYKCLNKLPSTMVEIQEYLTSCLDVVIQASIDIDNTVDVLNGKLNDLNNKNRELIKSKYTEKVLNLQLQIQSLLQKVKAFGSSRGIYLLLKYRESIIFRCVCYFG
jgi:hypothetical protein